VCIPLHRTAGPGAGKSCGILGNREGNLGNRNEGVAKCSHVLLSI
jgi:hypothetical protein